MRFLKQNTAYNLMVYMVSSTDHITGVPGITLTVTASKNGGAFAGISPTQTDRGNGWYNLALTSGHDDTLGDLALNITGAGCDATVVALQVIAVDLADGVRGGLTALPTQIPGAANGLLIAGTNAAFACSGAFNIAGGMTINTSVINGAGLTITGNGTGAGVLLTPGVTGNGLRILGGATSGSAVKISGTAGNAIGVEITGQGSAAGLSLLGGVTGAGLHLLGGATSGVGMLVTTTSGHGVSITALGSNAHGILITGGNGGVSDGVKIVAGTGGAALRSNITGLLTGSVGNMNIDGIDEVLQRLDERFNYDGFDFQSVIIMLIAWMRGQTGETPAGGGLFDTKYYLQNGTLLWTNRSDVFGVRPIPGF